MKTNFRDSKTLMAWFTVAAMMVPMVAEARSGSMRMPKQQAGVRLAVAYPYRLSKLGEARHFADTIPLGPTSAFPRRPQVRATERVRSNGIHGVR